ncbi:hypothetical protein [Selenomonas ruminantium]|uniref:hypothetical protein n=1 Tax=Selenomonas ruminantium TaxID=971 RepID=UPI0015A6A590|nr:hypothetical protein [Selenomonas ruminantium]
MEDEFDVNDLLALSDAVCQAGACKELAFAVLPFMLRLSEDVSEENKLHLFVESAMIYAYSYEIEDKIPDNLMCCLKDTVSKYRNKILEYYLANSFELTDEYYLVAAIMTFYNQKWGASILYGNLFPYESEIELDCCCPNLHDIVLYVNDDGICCLGEQPATNRSASNVMELSPKADKSNIQELLDVINKVLADKGLHTLKQFEEISESEAGVVFIVMGTMLMYAGYNEQAKRYCYMLNSIECPVCHQKFIPAEQWGR